MEMFQQFVLLCLCIFHLAAILYAQHEASSSYTAASTKLKYISDTNYIETGLAKSILLQYRRAKQQQVWSLRSFLDGIRNCYRFNLTRDSKYLIGTTFIHGNYDEQNILLDFNYTCTLIGLFIRLSREYQQGTPFISALELRPLKNNTYITQHWLAGTTSAAGCCAICLWYKDDAYDRVRWPYNLHKWDQRQKLLMLMKNLQADPCALQDYLWKGLNCSYPNDDSPRITSLNLSMSGLTEGFAHYVTNFKMLTSLNLGRNKLTGPLPVELIGKQKNNALELRYAYNLLLYSPHPLKYLVFVVLAALIGLWSLKRRKQLSGCTILLVYYILRVTNNFERVPYKGGFITVYHGQLVKSEVAMKMLSPSSSQGISPVEGGTHMSTTIAGTAGFLNTNTVDLSFKGEFDIISVGKAVEIAMASVSSKVNRRPLMNQVVMVREQGNGSRITIK
ncbi:protein kinase domain-containing protein [Citrus sinensis]|nr:protein kinase domain-containing protein [Citrus sinensis]